MSKKSKTGVIVIALCVIVLAVCAAVVILLYNGAALPGGYERNIQLAEEHLDRGEIDEAISCYWNAIDHDPSQIEAYIRLAKIYEDQQDYEMSYSVVKLGSEKTDDAKIADLMEYYEALLGSEDTSEMLAPETKAEPESAQPVELNVEIIDRMIGINYLELTQQYGTASVERKQNDAEVRFQNMAAVFTFSSEMVNQTTGQPFSSAIPESVRLEHLDLLFVNMTEDGLTSEQLQELIRGSIGNGRDASAGKYISFELDGCEIHIAVDDEGNVNSRTAWNEIVLPQANQTVIGTHTLFGDIVDAATGQRVSNAHVELWKGNAAIGESVASLDAYGTYSIEGLEAGNYLLRVSGNGYITEDFFVRVNTYTQRTEEDVVISGELASGEIRIVLEWGATPRDLDSYLEGKLDDGTTVRVNWTHISTTAGGKVVANLDVDDVDGYGPETTTIYDINGKFTFHVEDYNSEGILSSSGATVKVYLPNQSAPAVFTVSAEAANTWNVCTIDHGAVRGA